MIQFTHTISDINGLHARNALQLARAVEEYDCQIRVCCRDKKADGKQVLSLMGLGARSGEILTFQMEGEREREVASYLQALAKEIL